MNSHSIQEPMNNANNNQDNTSFNEPMKQKDPRGRKAGSKNKPKNMSNIPPNNSDEQDKKRKLVIYDEISILLTKYSAYFPDYNLNITINSDEKDLLNTLNDIRKIIVSKISKNMPNIANVTMMLIQKLKFVGLINQNTCDKIDKFRKEIISQYSYIEPEINELMVKYPWMVSLSKAIPPEITLALKLHDLWSNVDNPMKDKGKIKEENLPNKFKGL